MFCKWTDSMCFFRFLWDFVMSSYILSHQLKECERHHPELFRNREIIWVLRHFQILQIQGHFWAEARLRFKHDEKCKICNQNMFIVKWIILNKWVGNWVFQIAYVAMVLNFELFYWQQSQTVHYLISLPSWMYSSRM